MGREKDDGGGAAILLVLAFLGLLCVGGYYAYERSTRQKKFVIEFTSRGVRSTRPEPLDPLAPVSVADLEDRGRSADVANPETELTSGPITLRLRAVDDVDGRTLLRFMARESGFLDVASDIKRWNSDPIKGTLELTFEDRVPPLLVLAHGYAPVEFMPGELSNRQQAQTVRLARGTAIVGLVRDADSAPVRAARVELEYYGSANDLVPEDSPPIAPPEGVATLRRTDESGAYTFAGLPPGEYVTKVTIGAVERRSTRFKVTAGRWTTIDHWFDESHRLTVSVLRPDGLPSERTRVLVSKPNTKEPLMARYTGPDGQVTFAPLEPHAYEVTVVSDHGRHDALATDIPKNETQTVYLTVRLQAPPERD